MQICLKWWKWQKRMGSIRYPTAGLMKGRSAVLLAIILASYPVFAFDITIHKKSAEVWQRSLEINGEIDPIVSDTGNAFINGVSHDFSIDSETGEFFVPVEFGEGVNEFYVRIDSAQQSFHSDTLYFELGFELQPEIYAYATVSSNIVTLHTSVLANPDSSALSFFWTSDSDNQVPLVPENPGDSSTTLTIPAELSHGEYYFDVTAVDVSGDSAQARTFFTIDTSGITPFDIREDYAAWIDSAIIYEITPYIFEANGGFTDITARLSELLDLGINTIWIQPVMATGFGGQGYDIIDYFAVRNDLGTPDELRDLVQSAKSMGFRVMFDFVANHTSILHPYAEHTVEYGQKSHYYNFYQREFDNAPYSQHYHHHPDGFVYYFWEDLPNLNYENPEVRRWISEAALYWIREYDIDGYRFDAIWGVNARRPEFMQDLRRKIKSYKPEFLMLGEDKGTWPESFDNRFDVAYDWKPETSWVSHWSWQYNYDPGNNPTVFNHPNPDARVSMLRDALTNDGNGYPNDARIFRFMENNDTERFLPHHGLRRTKMVATLLFSLSSIPLIYNGQEVGAPSHPYETYNIFEEGVSIREQDEVDLYPFYQRLTSLRSSLPALTSGSFQELTAAPGDHIFAFQRWYGEQSVFCLLNLQDEYALTTLALPMNELNLDVDKTYYLTEQLSGQVYSGKPSELDTLSTVMLGYQAKMFVLADSIVTVDTKPKPIPLPAKISLAQNYPNPFNPITTIRYALPESGDVTLTVYDISGRRVSTLVKTYQTEGNHTAQFNGNEFPSGMYFYRLVTGEYSLTKKMILLK